MGPRDTSLREDGTPSGVVVGSDGEASAPRSAALTGIPTPLDAPGRISSYSHDAGRTLTSAADTPVETATATGSATLDASPEGDAFGDYRRGTSIGRYMVVDLLGQGAVGQVVAAYDPELDRRVAVKLLHTARASESGRKRLVREARALA